MTLSEFVIAGLITASNCSASLQVWSRSAQINHSARILSVAVDELERHVVASRRWLVTHQADCLFNPNHLASQLDQAIPLPESLQRSLTLGSVDSSLWLHVVDASSGLQRRQFITSAGLGQCWLPSGTVEVESLL